MRKVSILAFDDLVLFDLAVPYEIFKRARSKSGEPCYDVSIYTLKGKAKGDRFSLTSTGPAVSFADADIVVIPGPESIDHALPVATINALRRAHARGARLVSICTGAFLLAQTGLLAGKRATTHWAAAPEFKVMFPDIALEPNVLYVEAGRIFTSAGACAGIDLCLHLVRKDYGALVASQSARRAVMPLERSGGQAQFIDHKIPNTSDSLVTILNWMNRNLQQDMKVEKVAKRAAMSVRTFNRQFQKQVGMSPKRWLLEARVARARELLEATDKPISEISELVGFRSPVGFREQFKRVVTINPLVYRKSFRKTALPNPSSVVR